MASTRNINSKGDYGLEQNYYALGRNYNSYQHSQVGRAYRPALPDIGYMPSHMPRSTFSHNSVDIESMLYGINSTNLVTPQKPIKPELKTLPTMAFFDRLPVHMPKPLVVENNQRPYPI
jgi:hypothetical protein